MLRDALQWLGEKAVGSQEVQIVEVDETKYSNRALQLVPDYPIPEPDAIPHSTLRSLVAYLEADPDSIEPGSFLSVRSPTKVVVVTPTLGALEQRKVYAEAAARVPSQRFGSYLPLEEMGIYLRTCFAQGRDRDDVVAFLGGVKDTTDVDTLDDGVTQTVHVKSGLSMVKPGDVPGSIELQPYRTFHDVDQPASPFILRMRKGMHSPEAALFTADGGAWEHAAMERIHDYLERELEASLPVFA